MHTDLCCALRMCQVVRIRLNSGVAPESRSASPEQPEELRRSMRRCRPARALASPFVSLNSGKMGGIFHRDFHSILPRYLKN